MLTLSAFLLLVDEYGKASGLADATLSSRLFNDGKRISSVRAGAEIGVRRLEKATQWLSDNWPQEANWPDQVPRPNVVRVPREVSE